MYLPEDLWCMATITFKSQRLKNEVGAKNSDEDDEGCTRTTAKDKNKSHIPRQSGLASYTTC